tara:strand:+ start:38 stop:253 length:216 start_codon:yes stop_codon:yes gene_type:complete
VSLRNELGFAGKSIRKFNMSESEELKDALLKKVESLRMKASILEEIVSETNFNVLDQDDRDIFVILLAMVE